MARYQFEYSGQRYEFEAPDDLPQEQALQLAIQQLSGGQPQPQQRSIVEKAAGVPSAAGAGVAKGVMGMLSLPDTMVQAGKQGVDFLRGKLEQAGVPTPTFDGNMSKRMPGGMFVDMLTGPRGQPVTTGLPSYGGMKQAVEGVTGPMYEPKNAAEEYAGTVGEFVPGLLFPAGRAGQGLNTARELGQRLLRNVVAPAITSETAGQVTKGTSIEAPARMAGAVVGGAIPGAARRAITPYQIEPSRAQSAAILNREGIPTTAGQEIGNAARSLRWAEASAIDQPFQGPMARELAGGQMRKYTRAALRRAGINSDKATPDVLSKAADELGQQFEDIAQRAKIDPVTWPDKLKQNRLDALNRIHTDYVENIIPGTEVPIVNRITGELANVVLNNKRMDGKMYQGWRAQIREAINNQTDPAPRRALQGLQGWLDDMVTIGLQDQKQTVAKWKDLRRKWRNLKIIEEARNRRGEQSAAGIITPSMLESGVANSGNRQLNKIARARGGVRTEGQDTRFEDLIRAGEELLGQMPQSGTAPRANFQLMGNLLGGAVGGMFGSGAGPMGAGIGATAGAIAGPAALSRITLSPIMQAYFRNQVMGGPAPGEASRLAGFVNAYQAARENK